MVSGGTIVERFRGMRFPDNLLVEGAGDRRQVQTEILGYVCGFLLGVRIHATVTDAMLTLTSTIIT